MELHASLAAAVANALHVEHIPQLRVITKRDVAIENGYAIAPDEPNLGIAWDRDRIGRLEVAWELPAVDILAGGFCRLMLAS